MFKCIIICFQQYYVPKAEKSSAQLARYNRYFRTYMRRQRAVREEDGETQGNYIMSKCRVPSGPTFPTFCKFCPTCLQSSHISHIFLILPTIYLNIMMATAEFWLVTDF